MNADIPQSQWLGEVTVSGAVEGHYVIEEKRGDGTLVLRPEITADQMLRRHGLEPATLEQFETEHGPLQRRLSRPRQPAIRA